MRREPLEGLGHRRIAYNSCHDRHCPKCQGLARADWLDARQAEARAFAAHIRYLRKVCWVVYGKPPFATPAQVLGYLGRYTHRLAIANSRLLATDETTVSFQWRDYRPAGKAKAMTLGAYEFIRRFLLHGLPDGFHRIRHYGFLANHQRRAKLALSRRLLAQPAPQPIRTSGDYRQRLHELTGIDLQRCPCCGGTMRIVEILPGPRARRHPDHSPAIAHDNHPPQPDSHMHVEDAAALSPQAPHAPMRRTASRKAHHLHHRQNWSC